MTHVYVAVNITIIGSDNGLSPDLHQAIIWTNAGIFLIQPLGTNFSETLIEIHIFSMEKNVFENVVWKFAAILSRLQCVKIYFLMTFMLKIQGFFLVVLEENFFFFLLWILHDNPLVLHFFKYFVYNWNIPLYPMHFLSNKMIRENVPNLSNLSHWFCITWGQCPIWHFLLQNHC